MVLMRHLLDGLEHFTAGETIGWEWTKNTQILRQ